jgi:putative ABC transport system substrate-binding protein
LVEVRDAADLDRAIVRAAAQKAKGMFGAADSFFYQHRVVMTDLAIKHGFAHVGSGSENAAAGSLFSYGANFAALFRRSAGLVDKILKGAKPANIPVEQASVYELAVNLKTARALGIKLPSSFMLQATQVIE